MKKIPCLFVREFHGKGEFTLTEKITPGCEWIQDPLACVLAFRKWDGAAAMIKDGKLYKRYDCKKGKSAPDGFIPCQEPDEVTGHWPGWILCDRNKPEDKYFFEAFDEQKFYIRNGTYELCGPKINGNHENFKEHVLIEHTEESLWQRLPFEERTFEGIKKFLTKWDMEGIVFYHFCDVYRLGDPGMCKIRRRDFGLEWPVLKEGTK